jgi:hypothetical protein
MRALTGRGPTLAPDRRITAARYCPVARSGWWPVGVAQVATGGDPVSDGVLDRYGLGKSLVPAVPYQLAVHPDDKHPAGAGYQCHLTKVGLECGEQLLGQPGCARQPPALGAVHDLDPRLGHGHTMIDRRKHRYRAG